MTGPAIGAWAARQGWLHLSGYRLAFLSNSILVALLTLLAVGELIADKLPFVPSRLKPGPLTIRILAGALCGAALAGSSGALPSMGALPLVAGAIPGGVGAIAGSFLGSWYRRTVLTASAPGRLVAALLEDTVAVAGAIAIVTRFK